MTRLAMMLPFDFQPRTRVVFGGGALSRLGEIVRDVGGKRVLIVTDKGIVAAGHLERARKLLEKDGIHVAVFDAVRENPDTEDVSRCVDVARSFAVDMFVGLGGGSSMDTAKGANFILTNGGEMRDYHGVGKASKPMLPLVAIPTTAGTGSECQSFALIADPASHLKMACGDPKAAARVAILDPELTVSQPPRVTACTGVDALVHALETAVTKKRTELSRVFSREAFCLIINAFPAVLAKPDDIEARGAMLLGAAYAGMAIENSMLGCAHSAANPLTAHFGVIHGQAVGRLITSVMRRNVREEFAINEYDALAGLIGYSSFEPLIGRIEEILGLAGLDAPLGKLGVTEESIGKMAKEASAQWTASFNPVRYETSDFEAIYRELL
jgi:alcohol dehydrogenase